MKGNALTSAWWLLALCITCRATTIVYDPINHGTSVANELRNIVQWTETEVHSANTDLQTLHSYETEVLQLARFGNPAALRSIPGVSQISDLYQMYGALQGDYHQIQGLANPQNLQNSFNSILSTYQKPTWQGFTSASGTQILPDLSAFQFPTNDWNVASTVQQQLAQLEQKKQTLTQQRDANISAMNAATDQSTQQKFASMVNAQNGAISDINQSEQQLYNQGKLQQARNAAAQDIFHQSQIQRTQMSDLEAIDQGLTGLPVGQMNHQLLWNAQP